MEKEQEICMLLKSINQHLFYYAQEIYKPYGLTSVQFAILLELIENNHQKVTQLGTSLSMSKSNISAVLQRMQRHGLIERVKSNDDQRSIYVQLSEIGKKCMIQMSEENCINNTPFSNITEEKKTQILSGLRVLYDIVKECEEHE